MFSIVIPLYNKEQYIARTLESVLAQTFQNFEIIVVDDGSTDESVVQAEKFQDERIQIVRQKNAGVSVARNRGIKEAKYDLIAFLDADDEWLPSYLNTINNLVQEFPQCSVFATNYKIVDSNACERLPVNTELLKFDRADGVMNNYFEIATQTAPPVCASAVVVRKSALETVGGFPVDIPMGEDLLTWARLACKYPMAYSKTVSAIYHFYTLSEMMNLGRLPEKIDRVGMALRKLLDDCCLSEISLKHYIALWHKMRLSEAMKHGERLLCLQEVKEIVYFNKKQYKSYVMLFLAFLPDFVRQAILKTLAKYQEKKHAQR